MSYRFSTTLPLSIDDADAKTREALQAEGFGVLTEIDIQATMKKKLDADYAGYRILGACNPPMAHQALQAEPHIGLMLPCNVILRETEGGTEVSAVDPIASMAAIENETLGGVAMEVQGRLKRVIEALAG